MVEANQNIQFNRPAENLYEADIAKESLPEEATRLLNDTGQNIQQARTQTPIQTKYQKQDVNELKNFEEEVRFQKDTNVIEERSQYINALEQDRLQRAQQRDLLIDLRRERINNSGRTYSRNLDEGVQMQSSKKDFSQAYLDPNPDKPAQLFEETDLEMIDPSSEDFNEEFIAQSKGKELKPDEDKEKGSSPNEAEEESEDDTEEEHQKKSKNYYYFEDDEILEIDYRIMAMSEELDKKEGADESLTDEIERRIKRLATTLDKGRQNWQKLGTETLSDTPGDHPPLRTPPRSRRSNRRSPQNKLRKRLSKRRAR